MNEPKGKADMTLEEYSKQALKQNYTHLIRSIYFGSPANGFKGTVSYGCGYIIFKPIFWRFWRRTK